MALTQASMYILCTILVAVATVTVVARLRVRTLQKAVLSLDDWTAFGGLLVLWSVAGVIIAGTARNVFGTHTLQDPITGESDITHYDQQNVEYMWIVIVLGILSIGLVKLSVVLLYRRIFTISHVFNIYSTALLILVAVWTIGFLLANIFQCGTHPAAAWTSGKMLQRYCYNTSNATAARALTNVVMDIVIVVSPIPIVWRMRMTLTQKAQVTGIFALGLFAVAAGTVRAYTLLLDTWGPSKLGYRDLQGGNTEAVAWTLIEIVAALVGCCLPTLRPLIANTALGSFFSGVLSAMSLRSRSNGSSRQDECDDKLAQVTIGGTEQQLREVKFGEEKHDSLVLRDVGNLV